MSFITEAAMSYPASNGCRYVVIAILVQRSFVLNSHKLSSLQFFMKVFWQFSYVFPRYVIYWFYGLFTGNAEGSSLAPL